MKTKPEIQQPSRRQLLGRLLAALFGGWWAAQQRVCTLPPATPPRDSSPTPRTTSNYTKPTIVGCQYDLRGKVTEISMPDPDQRPGAAMSTWTYVRRYDAFGRLIQPDPDGRAKGVEGP